jgi:hypothetical protein
MMGRTVHVLVAMAFLVPSSLAQTTTKDLRSAIERLGDFDYDVRLEASRVLRRADSETVVPLLLGALREHEDSYVQFRAAVLFYGFEVATARAVFEEALTSPNDRVRAAAYEYFEQEPSTDVVSKLLGAMETETSEFVRPYLVRALAANDGDTVVQQQLVQEIHRGEGYFRGGVIEALGDHRAGYAVDALVGIISDEGPLRDDALLALGKIGDRRAIVPLSEVQRNADGALQPIVSATACLLEVNCEGQLEYIAGTLAYSAQAGDADSQELVRSAATALAALAIDGRRTAVDALIDVGLAAPEEARAPIAIALGTVALRNAPIVRAALVDDGERNTSATEARLLLLRDAFDILDEDFAEERFYMLMRRDYWAASEGSDARAVAEATIRMLEF